MLSIVRKPDHVLVLFYRTRVRSLSSHVSNSACDEHISQFLLDTMIVCVSSFVPVLVFLQCCLVFHRVASVTEDLET